MEIKKEKKEKSVYMSKNKLILMKLLIKLEKQEKKIKDKDESDYC